MARRVLEVFVVADCYGCARARELVAWLAAMELPQLDVRLIHLDEQGASRPPAVFAVPTYVLDGHVLSLGNPDQDWLIARLALDGPQGEVARQK